MSDSPPNLQHQIAEYQTTKGQFYWNLSHETIIISEDRARLVLLRHVNRLATADRWIGAAGITATLVATFCTTTFRDFVLDAATWRGVFVVATVLNVAWLIRAVINARNAPALDDIVRELKTSSQDRSA